MTTEMIITSIICFCLGFLIAAIIKPKADTIFRRQEIWEVESSLRGIDPVDAYDYCLNEGQCVLTATDSEKSYYVFDIYSEGSSFIAEERHDLEIQIKEEFKAMEAQTA